MKKKLFLMMAVIACLSLSSCYSHQLYVGGMKIDEPKTVLTTRNNNHFLFGVISPNSNKQNIDRYTKGHTKYAIKNNVTFLNVFLEAVTCGIYAPSRTTFYIPSENSSK